MNLQNESKPDILKRLKGLLFVFLCIVGSGLLLYQVLKKEVTIRTFYPTENGAILLKTDTTSDDYDKHFDYLERIDMERGSIWKTRIPGDCDDWRLGTNVGMVDYQVSLIGNLFAYYVPDYRVSQYLLLDYATGDILNTFPAEFNDYNQYFLSIADETTIYHLSRKVFNGPSILTAYDRQNGTVVWKTEFIDMEETTFRREPSRPIMNEEWLCLIDARNNSAAYLFSKSSGKLTTVRGDGPGILLNGDYYYFLVDELPGFYRRDLSCGDTSCCFTDESVFYPSNAKYKNIYFAMYKNCILFQTGEGGSPTGLKAVDMTTGKPVWEIRWPEKFSLLHHRSPGAVAGGASATASPFCLLENPYLALPLVTDVDDNGPTRIIILDLDKGRIMTEMNPVYTGYLNNNYRMFYHEDYFYMEVPIPRKAENQNAIMCVDSRTGETSCFQIFRVIDDREQQLVSLDYGLNPSLIRDRILWTDTANNLLWPKARNRAAAIDLNTGKRVYGNSKVKYRDCTAEMAAVYGF
jgi:hypothetical protein